MRSVFISIAVLLHGCATPSTSPDTDDPYGNSSPMSSGYSSPSEWAPNFPAAADLAILLDTTDEPVIDFKTRNSQGYRFLPASWLRKVRKAYDGTFAEDAIELENRDEDWRLVSIRVSPCAPIGIRPSVDIDEWCWPAVRLVWQPVVNDYRLAWGTLVDFYADDRAIHAIYPVAPHNPSGERIEGEWRQTVAKHLAQNRPPEQLQPHMVEGFKAVRDATARAVLGALHSLRDPQTSSWAYEELDIRPETYGSPQVQNQFRTKLRWFLDEFASPRDLDELTSFSLPEGRSPAQADLWIFVGFDGNEGRPTLKQLNVIGRESGRELVKIGPSQTVAVGVEDEAVENEFDRGNSELRDSIIVSANDIITKGDAIADPYEFLVPNTSCASCHRLNTLRFDFHSLSGFEDQGISVSPRVEGDVRRELIWSRTLMRR